MGRVIIGSVVAALAMFFIGFIFFASGLQNIASGGVDDTQAAAIQQSLAANLPRTGTYFVPRPEGSAAQTVMYGQGPVATIHYNTDGFPAMDPSALLAGLILNFLTAFLVGCALLAVSRYVPEFAPKARLGAIFAVAASAFMHLGEPIYFHHDWPHFIYVFIADAIALAAGAVIVAWFMTSRRAVAPADAPTEV